ncbi:MAG TPA: hypothetical protein VGD66_15180 [Allosphingosinicella sp.]|jgi:hypothetical protein
MKPSVALLAAALAAAGTAAPLPAAPPAAGTDATKKICRLQETIGSRLGGTRICRTRAEWEDLKLQSRRTVERVQSGTSACLRGGVCGN